MLPGISSRAFLSALPPWLVTNLIDNVQEALAQEAMPEALSMVNEEKAICVLRIPKPFAASIANDIMEHVAMCEMGCRTRDDVQEPGWPIGWSNNNPSLVPEPAQQLRKDFISLAFKPDVQSAGMYFVQPGQEWMRTHEHVGHRELRDLLQPICRVIPHIPQRDVRDDGSLQFKLLNLHNCMASAQQQLDLASWPGVHLNPKYDIDTLISPFMGGELLKSDAQLRNACKWCVKACLAKHVADSIEKVTMDKTTRVPSATAMCRTGARIDVAYIFWTRQQNDDMFDNHGGAVFYAMADKSPQGGREIEQVVMEMVKRSLLDILQCLIQEMESRRVWTCLCLFVALFVCSTCLLVC